MVVKIKPEQLDGAIREQLERYSAEVTEKINENLREVADKTADALNFNPHSREGSDRDADPEFL